MKLRVLTARPHRRARSVIQGGNHNNGRSAQDRAATFAWEAHGISRRERRIGYIRPLTGKQCTPSSPPCEPPSSPVPEAETKRIARNGKNGTWTIQGKHGPRSGHYRLHELSVYRRRSLVHKQTAAPLLDDRGGGGGYAWMGRIGIRPNRTLTGTEVRRGGVTYCRTFPTCTSDPTVRAYRS